MDTAFGLFFQGYPSLLKKFRSQQRDVLETNLLPFFKAIAMRGEDAARLFYDDRKFTRRGILQKTQYNNFVATGSPQSEPVITEHKTHTAPAQVMSGESINRLEQIFVEQWQECIDQWQTRSSIVLFNEAEKLLCITACQWLGIPLHEQEINLRAGQLSVLLDADGAVGPRYFRGRTCRKKLEMWLTLLTADLRGGRLRVPDNSVFHSVAFRKDESGNVIDAYSVALELLSVLKPIVAVARHIVFSALALHENQHYTGKLKANAKMYEHFVHEVRRYYPFAPMLAAKVLTPFEYEGVKFDKGVVVMLDIYATNHHENAWKNPGAFYPERFENWTNSNAFNFMQQASHATTIGQSHAGEQITTRLTMAALQFLNEKMQYLVPDQNLSIDINRLPAVPQSRFKIKVHSEFKGLVAL
jgi:fatty-acid peroxygenase